MAGEKKLQNALLAKEQIEGFLANLEKLNREGSVAQEQYDLLKQDYDQRLMSATSEVTALKVHISQELEKNQKDLEAYKWELSKLETRYKVGELSLQNYTGCDHKLRLSIDKTESKIAELKRLKEAESSSNIIGHMGVPIVRGMSTVSEAQKKVAASVPQKAKEIKTAIPQGLSFAGFVYPKEEIITPRTKLLELVGGFFLMISVFMKWISTVHIFGISWSFSGSDLSEAITAAGIICGIISIGTAFLAQPKARGILHIGMGAIAIIVFLAVWFSGPSLSELGEWGKLIEGTVKGMMVLREGVYLLIISAIAIIVGGLLDFKKG